MQSSRIEQTYQAALEVLHHNAIGPFEGLPRTAGWGYPEPYTRDWMIAAFGILASGDKILIDRVRAVLLSLAQNQSPLGQIPSLAHDPLDLGASDTTPLFLIGVALYRQTSGELDFLAGPVVKALHWMEYQSPDESYLVGQLPTSDWRDEQWVLGFGLYVNMLVFTYLNLYHYLPQMQVLQEEIQHVDYRVRKMGTRVHEGLRITERPYYALWAYKVLNNERFDLLGNCLAILTRTADEEKGGKIVDWINEACQQLRHEGLLASQLPPCLIPFIQPADSDWYPRMQRYNLPGDYHNGGIWPFVCGFYVAALVSLGRDEMAQQVLQDLTSTVEQARRPGLAYGFNEWHRAQDGKPHGQDWQTWSAAMYIYAVESVKRGAVPFFDSMVGMKPAPNPSGNHENGDKGSLV